jgi:hypothetical protein
MGAPAFRVTIFSHVSGWALARRAFGDTDLDEIPHHFDEAIAA